MDASDHGIMVMLQIYQATLFKDFPIEVFLQRPFILKVSFASPQVGYPRFLEELVLGGFLRPPGLHGGRTPLGGALLCDLFTFLLALSEIFALDWL